MSRPETDWTYLLRGAWLPLVALAIGAGLFAGGWWTHASATETHARHRQELAGWQQKLEQARRIGTAIDTYRDTFEELAASGVIARESRLNWVRIMRDSVREMHLPFARYAVEKQQPFSASYLPGGNGPQILSSSMKLELGLLHELDLIRLISKLRESPGLFHVSSCELDRVGDDDAIQAEKPNLLGKCTLNWFSMPTPSSGEAAG